MNHFRNLAAVVLCMAACAPVALAQGSGIHTEFEDDTAGWQAMQGGSAGITHEAAHVHNGKGALEYKYDVEKNVFSVLVRPTMPGDLANVKSIRLWVRADHQASIVMILNEKDGGHYNAMFTVPRDSWQLVELSPSDFCLGSNPDDPKDPDNKLDMDQVATIGLTDISNMFAQSPEMSQVIGVETGQHTMWLDSFSAGSEPVNASEGIDDFTHPQINWGVLGTAKVSRITGAPLNMPGMQLDYQSMPHHVVALLKAVSPDTFVNKKALTLTAASQKPVTLVVQVEETDGGKYNTTIDVPGNSLKQVFKLNLDDMKVAGDSKDQNDKLDLDKIKQVMIIDMTGATAAEPRDNMLWIGGVTAG